MFAAAEDRSERMGGRGRGRWSAEQRSSGRERSGSGSVRAQRAEMAVDDRIHMSSALTHAERVRGGEWSRRCGQRRWRAKRRGGGRGSDKRASATLLQQPASAAAVSLPFCLPSHLVVVSVFKLSRSGRVADQQIRSASCNQMDRDGSHGAERSATPPRVSQPARRPILR